MPDLNTAVLKDTPVVVTGASGFIAKYVIAELLKRGFSVIGTLRNPAKADAVSGSLHTLGVPVANLSFAAADLMRDDHWDEIVAGKRYVIHTASPFPVQQPDNADDLIAPAREGTLRVLLAAHRASVKRVVLTSSTVAVMYARDYQPGYIFSEDDFTDETRPGLTPYIQSKTLAEKAAWNFVKTKIAAPELAVINPAFVQGPALDDDLSTSHELMRLMAAGTYPAAPKVIFPVCDVRDVAAAHVEAMLRPDAAGQRFIIAEGETRLYDIGQRIVAECPDLKTKAPRFEMPDTAVRALAVFDKRLRTILPELGTHRTCCNVRARKVLGLKLRGPDEAIGSAARSLRALKLI
ncbi:MAG: aldehyde reductase [Hyphomicrobium sp.]